VNVQTMLNLDLLDENAESGMDDLRELIDMYFEQVDETVAGLRTAIDAGDAQTVNDLAHKLAGSSAVCGASGAIPALKELEQRSREGRLDGIEPLMNAAIERLDCCRRLLTEYLAEKGG